MTEDELAQKIIEAVLAAQKANDAQAQKAAAAPPQTQKPAATPSPQTTPPKTAVQPPPATPEGKAPEATPPKERVRDSSLTNLSAERPLAGVEPTAAKSPLPGTTTQPTSQPAAGCHTPPGQPLVAPPEGSPQPKFICREPKVDVGQVWKGKQAVVTFVVGNEGEGPLDIRLKGG
jgi:hypothetical protein